MIYRKEAVDNLRLGHSSNGTVLRATPRWVKWPFLVLLVLFAALTISALLSTRNEYVAGIAVVRADDLVLVTASSDCVVTGVSISPGDSIQPGQTLFETAAMRIAPSYPTSPGPGGNQSDIFISESIVAPARGVVAGIRARKGETVSKGMVLCTVVPANSTYTLTMFLPGNSAPLLKPGTPAWFSVRGFEDSRVALALEAVSGEAVERPDLVDQWEFVIDDNFPLEGRIVLAWGRLSASTFYSKGRELDYYDGLIGDVRVLTGTGPLIRFFSGES